jgi:hypothetical protein
VGVKNMLLGASKTLHFLIFHPAGENCKENNLLCHRELTIFSGCAGTALEGF